MQNHYDPEQERLKRLRARQLAERDPRTKQRDFQRHVARREQQAVEPFSVKRFWSEIPHIWKGMLYGLLLGVLALVIIPLLWVSTWAIPCAAALTLTFVVLGIFIGRAADARDELKDLSR